MKLKPSSGVPSQLLSMLSHASTPALVFTHSQPSIDSLLASKKFVKQVYLHTPLTHIGSEFGTTHEWKHSPQFEMSVSRSDEFGSHWLEPPPVPPPPLPPPPVPPKPPRPPPVPPMPVRSIETLSIPASVFDASTGPPSGGMI